MKFLSFSGIFLLFVCCLFKQKRFNTWLYTQKLLMSSCVLRNPIMQKYRYCCANMTQLYVCMYVRVGTYLLVRYRTYLIIYLNTNIVSSILVGTYRYRTYRTYHTKFQIKVSKSSTVVVQKYWYGTSGTTKMPLKLGGLGLVGLTRSSINQCFIRPVSP